MFVTSEMCTIVQRSLTYLDTKKSKDSVFKDLQTPCFYKAGLSTMDYKKHF